MNSGANKTENRIWFAMRVTYRRELLVQRMLEERNIENYIPKQYVADKKHPGKKVLCPVIHNIIFVYTTPAKMQELKSEGCIPYLQYMMDRRSGEKIIVPESQMRQFIFATADYDEALLYFAPSELNLAKGTHVRITGGKMAGMEGIFLKVKGARDRRVVVQIEGVVAVAFASIHPDLIEVIDDKVKETKWGGVGTP